MAFQKKLVFGVGSTTVQSVFDQLLPNVLPLAVVFLIYWLFKKKHVNTIAVIGCVILFGLLMSLLNWM